jgi:hypothetical protein
MGKNIQRKTSAIELDSAEIEEIFERAFQAVVDDVKNPIEVGQFDVSATKENVGKDVMVEVTIYGLAGSTTRTQFQDKKTKKIIKGGELIETDLGSSRDGKATFKLDHVSDLNTSDYRLYYKLVK